MTETFEGGCSCGAVRYRLTSRPMFTHCCHCLDCQNQTGSAFAINALHAGGTSALTENILTIVVAGAVVSDLLLLLARPPEEA